MFRTTLRVAAGAALVAAGLLASGCGPLKMGAAATVGDQRITGEQLDRTVTRTLDAVRERSLGEVRDMSSVRRLELSRKISATLLDAAADRAGIEVTSGDVDAFIARQGDRKQFEAQLLQQFGVPPQELRDEVRGALIRQRLADKLDPGGSPDQQQAKVSDYMRDLAHDLGVSVSPRYGRFDAQQLAIVPGKDTLSRSNDSSGPTQGQQGPQGQP